MRIDALEKLGAFQALLAELDPDHVENLARRDGKFAADDAVFGFCVPFDFDFLDVGFVAFLNLKEQVHRPGLHVGIFPRQDDGIDIAVGPVHVLQGFDIFGETFGRERVADVHLELLADLVGGEKS